MSLVVPSAPTTAGQDRRVKRGLRGFFQKYFSSFPDSPSSSAPPSPRGASPAASFRPSRRRRGDDSAGRGSNGNSPSASRPVTPLRSHHPPSGVTVADRPITQPRPERSQRRRRRRRTQSPVGLPIYSEHPTENEMSLFKSHDDAFPADGIYEEEDEDDDEDDDDDDDEDGQEEIEGEQSDADDTGGGIIDGAAAAAAEDEDSDAFFAMPPRQSFDTTVTDAASRRRSATNLIGTGGDGSGRPTLRGRPRAASEPLGPRLTQQTTRSSLSRSVITSNTSSNSPYLHGSSSPFASRSGLIELPPRPPSPPSPIAESPGSSSIRGFSFRPSYFTHRSSRSSPVFLNPDASSTTTRPPLLPTSASTGSFGGSSGGGGRPRASTLQKLMSSSAGTSNASLTPPSGFEPASWGSGASPYGSLGTRASGSQVSVGGRSISAPLANSFVHSSFVFPKTGPTPEQVAFISSRQAIGAYGYGAGASPPPALNIALSNRHPDQREREDEPVTSFTADEGVDRQRGLIAPVPVRAGRGRSGSEASRMSAGGSPLARTVQLPELDPPVNDGADLDAGAADDAVAAAEAAAAAIATSLAESEEDSSSSSDPATLAPTLPPLPTLDSITSGLSFSLADDEDGGDEPATIGAANSLHPRQPPAITTSAPTPTASAFPSPVVASHPSFTSNEPV